MSNPNLIFTDEPQAPTYRLQEVIGRLVDQLNDGATTILVLNVTLASGANKLRHGLRGKVPRAVAVIPHSNVTWYQTAAPDDEFLYITTGGALVGDLQVWL